MRQNFIIANLFLISTLVLSGCATQFGANLVCDSRAWSGKVKEIRVKTEKVVCTTTKDTIYGMNIQTVCEPEYKVVLDSNQYDRFMKTCMASMTKNK